MENLKNKIYAVILIFTVVLTACDKNYIDPITQVDPGPDGGGPTINIVLPPENFQIEEPAPVSSVNIQFNVEDDIEIGTIAVKVDGTQIATYDDFVDYRRTFHQLSYDNVTIGDHVLAIEATDFAGNTTISTVNFSKLPPYVPVFEGEVFYMNFNGTYQDLVTATDATVVGSPGFTTDAKVGSNAYVGATDSYLTFPASSNMLGSEISISFWYKMSAGSPKSGIITMAPYDDTAAPDNQNNINWGLRIFRDGANAEDLRLLVGNGVANRNYGHTIPTDEWVFVTATVEETNCRFYINGVLQQELALANPIDWAATDLLSIMSGAPTFTFVGHYSDLNYMDELRIFNKSLTQEEITLQYAKSFQTFNMSFDGSYIESVTKTDATEVGSPGFTSDAVVGTNAYQGASDSYLTFPAADLLGEEISIAFWYKMSAGSPKSGIITMAPYDDTAAPDNQNNINWGLRIFRDGANAEDLRLLVGNGVANRNYGHTIPTDEWVFVTATVEETNCRFYINGVLQQELALANPIDWAATDLLSIMSGAPTFTFVGHYSDLNYMDELQIFSKSLTQEEIQLLYLE